MFHHDPLDFFRLFYFLPPFILPCALFHPIVHPLTNSLSHAGSSRRVYSCPLRHRRPRSSFIPYYIFISSPLVISTSPLLESFILILHLPHRTSANKSRKTSSPSTSGATRASPSGIPRASNVKARRRVPARARYGRRRAVRRDVLETRARVEMLGPCTFVRVRLCVATARPYRPCEHLPPAGGAPDPLPPSSHHVDAGVGCLSQLVFLSRKGLSCTRRPQASESSSNLRLISPVLVAGTSIINHQSSFFICLAMLAWLRSYSHTFFSPRFSPSYACCISSEASSFPVS
jgi:hypothetical protein